MVNGQLILRWQGDDSSWKALPVINYQRTTLQLNGQPLTRSDIRVSTIGAVTVKQQAGLNELIVDYDAPWYFDWGLWVTMAAWVLLALGFLWKSGSCLLQLDAKIIKGTNADGRFPTAKNNELA